MSKFTVVRTEEEVGILCRIGDNARFRGVFKGRYSDFHVNEIDLNGKIVQLTCLEPPVEQKSEVAVDDPQICTWIPEDVRSSISSLQEQLEAKKSGNADKKDPVWKEKVQIQVTNLGKEERTKIHKWLGNFDKLHSETVENGAEKYIVALYDNKNNRNRRRPAYRAKYTHCTMYKEGVDTSEAIGLLSKKLRVKPNLITYCGTKDKYGKTTQRICVSNVDAYRLAQISKGTRNIKLGNFEYLAYHLRLGDLKGNHFKILLRDVIADSDESIINAIQSLESSGFINYFGLQRFGSYQVSTHAIGKSILQNKWVEAFDLILKPKNNDPDFMVKAKNDWLINRDASTAIKHIPHWHRSIESNVLYGLAKYYSKNDFIGVFLRLPRNVRHLYIHSFQSFLWNQVATYRIQKMGAVPVVGDLVNENKDQDDFYFEEEELESDDESIGSNQPSSVQSPVSRQPKIKSLTAEDLPNYTIFDVLIPIQGTQITIPESHIKEFYNKLLVEQGIDPDCFLRFKPIADQPKGAYRKLCVRPQNVSHKIIAYNDSDNVDTFIPSGIDRLNAHEQRKKNGSQDNCEIANNEHIDVDVNATTESVKDKKCVIVEFSLPSSSYATMALREIIVSNSEATATGTDTKEGISTSKRSVHDASTENPGDGNDDDASSGSPEAKRRKEDMKENE